VMMDRSWRSLLILRGVFPGVQYRSWRRSFCC
jgi:hypothetical protein